MREMEKIYRKLRDLKVTEVSLDEFLQTKITKIISKTDLPATTSEQTLTILLGILELKSPAFQLNRLNDLILNSELINTLVRSSLTQMQQEQNTEFQKCFSPLLSGFIDGRVSETQLTKELTRLYQEQISVVDMDFVMKGATQARKVTDVMNKQAIVVLGKTGAGKSFSINWIGYPQMVKRGFKMLGHKLTIDESMQPSYLKQIKSFGSSVVSETSEIGVVSVDDFEAANMKPFKDQGYVFCDTPGAADNRDLGPELKLINNLQIIAPLSRAKSLRFLVILSDKAISARGAEFRETLCFIAKMFVDEQAITSAIPSMVFAINGDQGRENLSEFNQQLKEFQEKTNTLGLNEPRIKALMKGLTRKFEQGQVLLIRPGKDHTTTPVEMMQRLHACNPVPPSVLNPFAEQEVADKLRQEADFVSRSIYRTFATLRENLEADIMRAQVQHLLTQLTKISFIETYYTNGQSHMQTYFNGLFKLMHDTKRFVSSILCPSDRPIDLNDVPLAIDKIHLLKELDDIVRPMIHGIFSDNRKRVLSLIRAFRPQQPLIDNVNQMSDGDWSQWVINNLPTPLSHELLDEIRTFSGQQFKALGDLLEPVKDSLVARHSEHVARMQQHLKSSAEDNPVVDKTHGHRKNTSSGLPLDETYGQLAIVVQNVTALEHHQDELSLVCSESSVPGDPSTLSETNFLSEMDHAACLISESKEGSAVSFSGASVSNTDISSKEDPKDTIKASTQPIIELAIKPSAPTLEDMKDIDNLSVKDRSFEQISQNLLSKVDIAAKNNQHYLALLSLCHLDRLYETFNKAPDFALMSAKTLFSVCLCQFIDEAQQCILTEDDVSIFERMFVITELLSLNIETSQCLHQDTDIKKTLDLLMNTLITTIKTHITAIKNIFSTQYNAQQFAELGKPVSRLLKLRKLVLPAEQQDIFEVILKAMHQQTSDYLTRAVGIFIGHLDAKGTCQKQVYEPIRKLLDQLETTKWVDVLDLSGCKRVMIESMNKRLKGLLNKIKQADMRLGNDAVLEDYSSTLAEMRHVQESFADEIKTEINQALNTAHQSFDATLRHFMQSIPLEATRLNQQQNTIPIEYLANCVTYLKTCGALPLFKELAATPSADLNRVLEADANKKRELVSEYVRQLDAQSSSTEFGSSVNALSALLSYYRQLHANLPTLYCVCGQPLATWTQLLKDLVSHYRQALTNALESASMNGQKGHKPILDRVNQLRVLDSYLQTQSNSEELPLNFAILKQRFQNAFDERSFPKIRPVIQAILAGQFKQAVKLTSKEKELRPGSMLRITLVDQVDTYIHGANESIQRSIRNLDNCQSAQPPCIKELTSHYKRIVQAQKLISAGLLSKQVSTHRAQLLNTAPRAAQAWFSRLQGLIDATIKALQFRTASELIEALETSATEMQALLGDQAGLNRVTRLLKKQFVTQVNSCLEQFKSPVSAWNSLSGSLTDVTQAFVNASNLNYEKIKFQIFWSKISTKVLAAVREHCQTILSDFSGRRITINDAASRLESVNEMIRNMPDDDTQLKLRLKQQIIESLDQIQQTNCKEKNNRDQLENIQNLLAANARIAPSLGDCSSTSLAYITKLSNHHQLRINQGFNDNQMNVESTVMFCDITHRFGHYLPALTQRHKRYQQRVKSLVEGLCQTISSGLSFYQAGDHQAHHLESIYHALTKLIEVQRVAFLTKDKAPLVDEQLPDDVITLLLTFEDTLAANCTLFNNALEGRVLDELTKTLLIANRFEHITQGMVAYVEEAKHCVKQPLKGFKQLKDLNQNYSYSGLSHQLLLLLSKLKKEFASLAVERLGDEGKEVRKQFYAMMKKDIDFLKALPSSSVSCHINTPSVLARYDLSTNDYGLGYCLGSTGDFLATIFREARLELTSSPTVKSDWFGFNRYYQELAIYLAQCRGSQDLMDIEINNEKLFGSGSTFNTKASALPNLLEETFKDYLQSVIEKHKTCYIDVEQSQNTDDATVSFLAAVQKMVDDIPVVATKINLVIKDFLEYIRVHRDEGYMSYLAEQLRSEESGFGSRLVATQAMFSGMNIALRNKKTLGQDINYVLKHLEVQDAETGAVRLSTAKENKALRSLYNEFFEHFETKLDQYTAPSKDFATYGKKVHLDELRRELMTIIDSHVLTRDANNRIAWDQKAKTLIPILSSYVFVIWTLKESEAFFDRSNVDRDKALLKVPHPAQMVAVFLMLSGHNESPGLKGHFAEVLTGQGKSVVLAGVASLLALLGFNVDVGCYSEYLSDRDGLGFKWLFSFLQIDRYIQYGTFNRLSEDMLTRDGDVRSLIKARVLESTNMTLVHGGTSHGASTIEHHTTEVSNESKTNYPLASRKGAQTQHSMAEGRETIALIDEVDSLVTAFFGKMYQPYFLLQSSKIKKLLERIWQRHTTDSLTSVTDIYRLAEYRNCEVDFADCSYLLRAAVQEMVSDLSHYEREHGHEFYVNSSGEIYYKHFDGTSLSKSIGYKTYWACCDQKHHIHPRCKERHIGIKVSCGAYSYADMMLDKGRYLAMLGVTGTYKELSAVEKLVVKDVFGIERSSFLPSVYGQNKLRFKTATHFTVVEDDDFTLRLIQEITNTRSGWNSGQPIRPVLVFFDTEEALDDFYESPKFRAFREAGALRMTSKTITDANERDNVITRATRAGQITLATREHGRGSDFILTAKTVIANGGMQVIDAFVPETEAEQRQHQGRAARQDQDGAFSMVVALSELKHKFQITARQVDQARQENRLYQLVSDARNAKFSQGYQQLVDDAPIIREKLHEPSMKLLSLVRDAQSDPQSVIDAHRRTISGSGISVEQRNARIIILFDSTGSMGGLIDALKTTLKKVVRTLEDVLQEQACTFELQIAHYRDYHEGPGSTLIPNNEWTCDAEKLQDFINDVEAQGGGCNQGEAVEMGLFHALKLAENSDSPVDHVLLIGDEPPNVWEEIASLRSKYGGSHRQENRYWQTRFFRDEANALREKGVPVTTNYIKNSGFSESKTKCRRLVKEFEEIAHITGGETGELRLSDPDIASRSITELFSRKVISAVAKGDIGLERALIERFKERIHQFSGGR